MATDKGRLLRALEDLEPEELETFQYHLKNPPAGYTKVRRGQVLTSSHKIAGAMVMMHTISKALKLAVEILKEMGLTDIADGLAHPPEADMEPTGQLTKGGCLKEYEMKPAGKKRGFCLIINNYDFSKVGHLGNRDGTDYDKGNLLEVFKWLGYEVEVVNDYTREDMQDVLKELAEKKDHTKKDSLVCCVLSHGREGAVYGVDGKTLKISEITEPFKQCPSLNGKPKLFFIQACQVCDKPGYDDGGSPDADAGPSSKAMTASVPSHSDTLIGMATVSTFASYRDTKKGSWYIQSLCRNLIKLVPSGRDLLSILTEVNREVCEMKGGDDDTKRQVPKPEYTLTGQVVFPKPTAPVPDLE